MKILNWISKTIVVACVCALSTVNAGEQQVTPKLSTVKLANGESTSISIDYKAKGSNSSALSGLGLSIHFDSSKLQVDIADPLVEGFLAQSSVSDDVKNDDEDASTDKVITIAWASMNSTWPGSSATELFKLNLTRLSAGESSINFSAKNKTAPGFSFNYQPVVVKSGK